jgi:hypothetical protein
MYALSIIPPWIIEEPRREREERDGRRRPRVELPVPPPAHEDGRDDDRRRSTVIVIQVWG